MATLAKRGGLGSFSIKIETAANIATLLTAVLLSVMLVKAYFFPVPPRKALPPGGTESVAVGTSLNNRLPGLNGDKNGQTLILALSTQCHFCTESAPFFRQLSGRSGSGFKIIAVLPRSVMEAQDYLKREGVHVDQISQMPLDRLGVAGTPTMLLLNKRGTVTKSWVGKLSPEEQSQALKAIGAAT